MVLTDQKIFTVVSVITFYWFISVSLLQVAWNYH